MSCPVELCEVQLYVATNLAKSSLSSRVAGVWSTDLGAWADYRAGEAMTLSAWASMRSATFLGALTCAVWPCLCGTTRSAYGITRSRASRRSASPRPIVTGAPAMSSRYWRRWRRTTRKRRARQGRDLPPRPPVVTARVHDQDDRTLALVDRANLGAVR